MKALNLFPLTVAQDKIVIDENERKLLVDEIIRMQENTNTNSEYAWIIDPIDGTKELINGSDEFTLNIALINNQKPILGAIYQPMKDSIFLGGTDLRPKKIIKDCRKMVWACWGAHFSTIFQPSSGDPSGICPRQFFTIFLGAPLGHAQNHFFTILLYAAL